MRKISLQQLTQGLDVNIQGDPQALVMGVATIQQAQAGSVTFLVNSRYRKFLEETRATAVILDEANACHCKTNAIVSKNPSYTYAKIAALFAEDIQSTPGIHPSCVVGVGTIIDPSAIIGANCVLGAGVKIGANVSIGPGCIIGDGVVIDEATRLDARVTLYHAISIGKRCRLASGVVIGCDGFGFANHQHVWHKIPQLGSVIIGDDVDVGANTTIDRGAIDDTVIENGVKLDNLIQVGHNVVIGENTIVAGCVGIAGSTIIGKNCMIGGATNFAGHVTITDHVIVTGMTAVTKSIHEPGMYSSGIVGAVPNHEFRKNNARFHRLENLMQRVKALEVSLKDLMERKFLASVTSKSSRPKERQTPV